MKLIISVLVRSRIRRILNGAKKRKEQRIHAFLSELDAKHRHVKDELLRMPDPSSLAIAFIYICKDEALNKHKLKYLA